MKVLILANNDVGLYQFRKELIQELLKNHTVTISLPYGELVEPLKEMGCTYIDTPVDRRGLNLIKDLKLLFYYLSIIKKQNPELVITYTVKPNIYGGLVCRLRKISYAVNVTGLGTAFQKQGMLRKLVTFLYKVSLKKAKVVFFENVENRQIFINEKIITEKQACLLNGAGVNLDHYYLADYPQDEETIRFLFIGRVMQEKGIDELFGAMELLRREGIQCVLDVVGSYEDDYKDIIEKYEKDGWLKYHGYQKDVRPFIEKAHCFVLPSWHEGMANTNLECAAMGRPIITSNIHGCKEAVIEGKSGFLCEKQNVESLYKCMKLFLDLDNLERASMGTVGRRHMADMFDKEKVVKKTIKVLWNNKES